jgi:hypothetical protein
MELRRFSSSSQREQSIRFPCLAAGVDYGQHVVSVVAFYSAFVVRVRASVLLSEASESWWCLVR